jgi:hypothetical protein
MRPEQKNPAAQAYDCLAIPLTSHSNAISLLISNPYVKLCIEYF